MTTEAAWRTSCLSFTLPREGGSTLSKDRKDPGNWTGGKVNYGKFVGSNMGSLLPLTPPSTSPT